MPSTKFTTLKRYIEHGLPTPDDFEIKEVDVPEPSDGEVLVELMYVSVDPYMRGRMKDIPGYFVGPFKPGQPCDGGCVGVVKKSKAQSLPEGALVSGGLKWQQLQVVPAESLMQIDTNFLKEAGLPASVYQGPLGMVGMTAYGSLSRIGKPKKGETVFISGAAGAVGLIVGQLCKNVYGCRVVGTAGSDEKIKFLKENGYDDAFNYKTTKIADGLDKLCPNGIDVYFDNVGGEMLDAALLKANLKARFVICGTISQYNAKPEELYGIKNMFTLVTKRIHMEGFISGDFLADKELGSAFIKDMTQYVKEAKVTNVEHVFQGGLEGVGQAFIDMMGGANTGKSVVQCGSDPYRK